MSDTNSLFPSYFWAGAGNDKNVPQALRQRLALALLAQKRKYPTTLGEGLGAIGDSLGDIGMMRRIEGEAAAAELTGQKALEGYQGGSATPPPTPSGPPPVAAAAISSGEADPTSQAPVPPTVQEGGPPRGMTLRPGITTPPPMTAAAPAVPTPPDQQQSYAPGAPVRMSTEAQLADFRGQNPLPPNIPPPPGSAPRGLPPQPPTDKIYPENEFNPIDAASTPPPPARPSVADYGQKLALAATPPPPGAPPPGAAPASGGDDPRRAIAMAMLRQQMPQAFPGAQPPGQARAMPPPPPPPAAAPSLPPPDQGIAAAPPVAPPIAKAPPPQMAQAPAVPPPGYVLTPPTEPDKPPITTPGMQRLQAIIDRTPASQRDSVKAALEVPMAQEQAKLAQEQKIYDDKLKQRHELVMEQERQRASAAGRTAEYAVQTEAATKAAAENKLRAQFANLPPEDVIKNVNESKKIAKSGADALQASQAAMEAFKKGAITGFGAEKRLDVAKLFTAMGLADKGNTIANTEVFRSAMQPVVAAILHQTSGTSQLSEGELAFAKAAAAGNINLDPQSIERLMTIIDKRSREVIKDHQTLTGALFGDEPRAKALYGVEMPRTRDDDARDWATKNPGDPRAAEILKRLGRP